MERGKLWLILVLIAIMIASVGAYAITGSVFPLILGSVVSVVLFSACLRTTKR